MSTGTGGNAPLRVLVYGANGPTGRQVTEQALAAGHAVTAVTRRPGAFPLRHDRLEVLEGDATDEASVDRAVRGQDAVLSALGAPYSRAPVSLYSTSARLVVAAMHRHGVRRLVAVTSVAVDPAAGSQGKPLLDHVVEPLLTRVVGRTLYEDMRRMEALVRDSGLAWTLVRPPALCDADAVGPYEVGETFVRGAYATRHDVAAFLVAQVRDEAYAGKVACVVSPHAHPSLLRILWRDGLGRR